MITPGWDENWRKYKDVTEKHQKFLQNLPMYCAPLFSRKQRRCSWRVLNNTTSIFKCRWFLLNPLKFCASQCKLINGRTVIQVREFAPDGRFKVFSLMWKEIFRTLVAPADTTLNMLNHWGSFLNDLISVNSSWRLIIWTNLIVLQNSDAIKISWQKLSENRHGNSFFNYFLNLRFQTSTFSLC